MGVLAPRANIEATLWDANSSGGGRGSTPEDRETEMVGFFSASLCAVTAAAGLALAPALAEEPVVVRAEGVAAFKAPEARQGVAVDSRFFYAIDNRRIAKYDKKTGQRVGAWISPEGGPVVHLNSGVVVDGKVYAAHSKFPDWPEVSSVEIWDAATLKHIGTQGLGIDRGSLTWLDYHDGAWWGCLASYNPPFGRGNQDTRIVRFGAGWQVAEAWAVPEALLAKFGDMSNSGGSWGPDGRLWITGHDRPEAYALMLPQAGPVLRWVAVASLDIAGQGIAWDRSEANVLWGIVRSGPGGESRVTANRLALP